MWYARGRRSISASHHNVFNERDFTDHVNTKVRMRLPLDDLIHFTFLGHTYVT
jgi:hypothetical protein